MSEQLIGNLDFPVAWLDGKGWLIGPEIVAAHQLDDGAYGVIAGGVLSDGTNVLGMSFPRGQRLMRISPDTDWAIEERFDGETPSAVLLEVWPKVVESMRLGMQDAREELGRER